MRRMRRQMSMITDFDEETLRKLEKVDPARARRIRANIERSGPSRSSGCGTWRRRRGDGYGRSAR